MPIIQLALLVIDCILCLHDEATQVEAERVKTPEAPGAV